MLTQNEIKYFSKLKQKKFRQIEKKFLVEGYRLVKEALESNFTCKILIVNNSFLEKNRSFISTLQNHIRLEVIEDSKFYKLSETKSPQGIIAVMSVKDSPIGDHNNGELIVALENISDPGNVGTIIRTCDWFGIRRIIISHDSVDLFNPKVIRSTMGSLFHLDVYESEYFYKEVEIFKDKGWEIICSDTEGENIFAIKINHKVLLVLSNEAHGPTDRLLEITDRIITIPKIGSAESLNVASAAAVIIAQLKN